MSVLKIKDANSNWQEIASLRGPTGPTYELTAADKAAIVDDVLAELTDAETEAL